MKALARLAALLTVAAAVALPTGGAAETQFGVTIAEPDGRGSTFAYVPNELVVTVGDTIVWTNTGNIIHTITADDGSFDSGIVEIGNQFSFTPTFAGAITYHCRIHPMQTGTIWVQDAPADGSLQAAPEG